MRKQRSKSSPKPGPESAVSWFGGLGGVGFKGLGGVGFQGLGGVGFKDLGGVGFKGLWLLVMRVFQCRVCLLGVRFWVRVWIQSLASDAQGLKCSEFKIRV